MNFLKKNLRCKFVLTEKCSNCLGDSCKLYDGSSGICRLDKECNYVIDLLKSGKKDQVVRCGFRHREAISCCKEKFSKRFSTDILCEGKQETAPVKYL